MAAAADLTNMIHSLDGAASIEVAKSLDIKKAVCNPADRTLALDFFAGEGAELAVKSSLKPKVGKYGQGENGLIQISVEKGQRQTLQLQFE